jgi:predicted RND superfamily exporter protein
MAESTSRFLGRYLRSLARIIYARPGTILLLAVAGTILSVFITVSRFKVVNNISDLLNANSPENRAYLAYKKEFGVDEEYIVVIHSDDVDLNHKAADDTAARLREIGPGISKIFYKLDFSRLEKRFLLFESEDELKQIEEQVGGYAKALTKQSIKLDLNSMLDVANRSFDDKYLRKSSNWKEFMPFVDRFSEMLNKLADEISSKGPVAIKPPPAPAEGDDSAGQSLNSADLDKLLAEHEYPASFHGGRTILVMATPGVRESNSESPYSHTLQKIRENLAELKKQYPTVSFGLTGEPVLNDDEMQTAKKDTIQASIITLILITTLFAISYRDRQRPVYAIIVLLVSVAWSLP